MTPLIVQFSQQYYIYIKKNNRVDIDSIYKQIIKTINFEDVTKDFPDNRIHILINDEIIINKIHVIFVIRQVLFV